MLWNKVDRALKVQKERNEKNQIQTAYDAEEVKLEKGDMPAMVFSAWFILVPVCLGVLLLLAGIPLLLIKLLGG